MHSFAIRHATANNVMSLMLCAHVHAGWLNVLGQFALTAFAGFFMAQHLAAMWLLSNGHAFSPLETLLVYASALSLLPPNNFA